MRGFSEYVLAARPVAAYEVLVTTVRERQAVVVRVDARHLTLAFRPGGFEWGEDTTVIAAVLDAGHGLSKLVLAGCDRDGETFDLGDAPTTIFAEVEQKLRSGAGYSVDGSLVSP